ncbi:hypothetical protein H6503_00505 [Candidatus Woesearchaeota archaeon]|nr:hypothetical protein [Candidatus Woesearchaeota archaeon]
MELFAKKKEDAAGSGNTQQAPKPPQGQGFLSGLGGGQKQQPMPQGDFAKDINEVTRRIRINEERSVNIRKKTQMIEHNMLMNHKKILSEIKYVNEEIGEIKRSFEDLKTKVMGFARELQQCAKKEDVQVLERYINMWEPVSFVTKNEVERIIEEKLSERR